MLGHSSNVKGTYLRPILGTYRDQLLSYLPALTIVSQRWSDIESIYLHMVYHLSCQVVFKPLNLGRIRGH